MSSSDVAEAIRGAVASAIEVAKDGSFRRRYVFAPDFPGFAGHFPGRPILPAVVQIMAASLQAEAASGEPLTPTAIERAKFVSTIAPGALVEISCRRAPGAAPDRWEVRIDADRQAAASFVLTLQPRAAGA